MKEYNSPKMLIIDQLSIEYCEGNSVSSTEETGNGYLRIDSVVDNMKD